MMQPPGQRKKEKLTFSSILHSLWRGLSNHLPLKVLSLLIAVLIWGFIISSDATLTREKTFADVEVTVSGADTLRQRGLIVLEDVAAMVPTVTFTAEVPQASYERATGTSFGPRIDLTRIRSLGTQELTVTMTSNSFGNVTQIDPAAIEVTVERYTTRTRIPITIEVTGELQEGLWADTPRSDPSMVTVGGPEPLLQRVVRGVAYLDASLLTGNTQIERNATPFSLLDEDGNALDSSLLTVTYEGVILDSVTAEVYTYPTALLPVHKDSAVTGTVAEGYRVDSIDISPADIKVAIARTASELPEEVFVETPVDITDLTESVTAPSKLKRITDSKNYSAEEVTITVNVVEATRTRTLRGVPVEIRNLDETAYTARLATSKVDVTVTGPYHKVADLTASDIQLWVDASTWTEDARELPVNYVLDKQGDFEITLSTDTVRMHRYER